MSRLAPLALLALLAGCASVSGVPAGINAMPDDAEIRATMISAADYMIENRVIPEKPPKPTDTSANVRRDGWISAPFYMGALEAYRTLGEQKYLDFVRAECESFDYGLTPRNRRLADDHAIGQVYLELYMIDKDPRQLKPMVDVFNESIANPHPGHLEWHWCDALFMAPPTLTRLYAVTGERKYLDYLNAMFWDTTDLLFDPVIHLYYRDARYLPPQGTLYKRYAKPLPKDHDKRYTPPQGDSLQRNELGQPNNLFWSRGKGWVFSGIARVLDLLPKDDPRYNDYVKVFQEMADKLIQVQGEDGYWRTSLLEPASYPEPETSGTGFFTHGLAWGINRGILDRAKFGPHAVRGWNAMQAAVAPSGRLQWVQTVAAAPNNVKKDDTQEYAVGALLLAGGEMLKLNDSK